MSALEILIDDIFYKLLDLITDIRILRVSKTLELRVQSHSDWRFWGVYRPTREAIASFGFPKLLSLVTVDPPFAVMIIDARNINMLCAAYKSANWKFYMSVIIRQCWYEAAEYILFQSAGEIEWCSLFMEMSDIDVKMFNLINTYANYDRNLPIYATVAVEMQNEVLLEYLLDLNFMCEPEVLLLSSIFHLPCLKIVFGRFREQLRITLNEIFEAVIPHPAILEYTLPDLNDDTKISIWQRINPEITPSDMLIRELLQPFIPEDLQ